MSDRLTDSHYADGYDAALRSLGAGTPEAQAALRNVLRLMTKKNIEVLGKLITAAEWADQHDKVSGPFWMPREGTDALRVLRVQMDAFAALATPTEEGG